MSGGGSYRPRWWRRRKRQKVAFTWPNGWHCYYTPRARKDRDE